MKSSLFGTRVAAVVDLGRIIANFRTLSSGLGEGCKRMAVVKADAYGHGAVEVARALSGLAELFGVATVDEGLELRAAGIKEPVLVLSPISEERYADALGAGLSMTLCDRGSALSLSRAALGSGIVGRVHIAVDTGMGRIGFSATSEGAADAFSIAELPMLSVEGVFSHFSSADETEEDFTLLQTERFLSFYRELDSRGVRPTYVHIANTAAVMIGRGGEAGSFLSLRGHRNCVGRLVRGGADFCNTVRLGIGLYGVYPSPVLRNTGVKLLPAMRVVARVCFIKWVEAGEPIGYGRSYIAEKKSRIATLSVGYADGYPRALSGVGQVLAYGVRCPVVGRVCMDQIMVDVTEQERVGIGDYLTLLGADGDGEITAEELGELSGTIGYEALCRFSHRVKRVYLPPEKT